MCYPLLSSYTEYKIQLLLFYKVEIFGFLLHDTRNEQAPAELRVARMRIPRRARSPRTAAFRDTAVIGNGRFWKPAVDFHADTSSNVRCKASFSASGILNFWSRANFEEYSAFTVSGCDSSHD